MKMRKFFILVPSMHPAGPIKGAIALANVLCQSREITLVSLKGGPGADAHIDPRVKLVSLKDLGNFFRRLCAYKKLLRTSGTREEIFSLSFCFSADMTNIFCRNEAIIGSSVRGNLPKNYLMDYGPPGMLLAAVHLVLLRCFDRVTAMSHSMSRQISTYSGISPILIRNFLDEPPLDVYRSLEDSPGIPHFIFIGSLSKRKCPLLLLRAFSRLYKGGLVSHLHFVGNGPWRKKIIDEISRLNLEKAVTLHGQLENPYPLLARASVFVLPSLSEGASRAALEALYFGIPCVLRSVDGNGEIITEGINGRLFATDAELPAAMYEAAKIHRAQKCMRKILLPDDYRQQKCAQEYLNMMEDI